MSRSFLVSILWFLTLGNAVFSCARSSFSSIMMLLPQSHAVLSCAWTCLYVAYHTTGKKGFLGAPGYGVSTHHLPENTTVEFSHFVGVNYTWNICLHPASPWQTGVTLCDPVFIQIRHRHTQAGSSILCKAHELTLLWVVQLQHPLKVLMSWLKYYSLEIPMQASFNF